MSCLIFKGTTVMKFNSNLPGHFVFGLHLSTYLKSMTSPDIFLPVGLSMYVEPSLHNKPTHRDTSIRPDQSRMSATSASCIKAARFSLASTRPHLFAREFYRPVSNTKHAILGQWYQQYSGTSRKLRNKNNVADCSYSLL